jgi:hypothetical protein
MRLRQDGDDAYARTCVQEYLDGSMKYGLAIQFEELLRHFRTHSRAASGSHYDSIFSPCHLSVSFRKKIKISCKFSSAKLSYFL